MTYTPGLNGGRINATIGGNTAGAGALISTGTMQLAGGNNITLSQNANSLTVSGANQTNPNVSLYGLGNTTQNSSTLLNVSNLSLNGAGIMTVGYSNGSIQLSATQSNQAASASNGSFAFQTLNFSNANNVTFGTSAGGIVTASVSPGGGAAGSNTFGISNLGNTAGTSGTINGSAEQLLFAGGNNVTLSQSINGASATITVSAANQSVQTQSLIAGIYDGAVSISTGTVMLSDANGVSFGINGNTITASVAAGGADGYNSAQFTNSTANTTMPILWAGNSNGSGNITMGLTGSTVTASAAAGGGGGARVMSYWENLAPAPVTSNGSILGTANGTMIIQPLAPFQGYDFPGNITAQTAMLNFSGSVTATASSSSHSISVMIGIYTMANSTQLSLANSVASTWALAAATSNSAAYHGARFLTFHSSQWSSSPAFVTGSQYWWGAFIRVSNLSIPRSWMGQWLAGSTQRSGTMGVSIATATSIKQAPFLGVLSASTSAIPVSIAASQVMGANVSAGFMPHLVFNNLASSF